MAPTKAPTTRRAAVKAAPEPEVVEDEFEDMEDDTEEVEDDATDEDDLEELDEDDEPEAPAKATKSKAKAAPKTAAPKKPAIEFGSAQLAAYITENTKETYDGRAVRMLLRKLAKDEVFQREVGVTRDRYSFSGPEDPIVVAVLEMVKSGAAKELKQAGLQAVKNKAAAAKAQKAKDKAAAAEAEEADVEEDEEDVVEATPAPKRRAAKTPAPAKATPATTRRRAAAPKA